MARVVRRILGGAPLVALVALVVLVPSRAEARGCREVSDVVGEEKCTRYGGLWSLEGQLPILSHFGMRYDELSTSGAGFSEQINKESRPPGYKAFSYQGDALGVKSLTTLGIDGGLSFFIYRQLYMGFEGSVGIGNVSTASFTASNGVKLFRDSGIDVVSIHGGIPVGYRIPLGRAALRTEIVTGFATIDVEHRTDTPGLPSTVTATQTRVVVEPRMAADIWFTQHISFGFYGGVNVLDFDGRSRGFGISLAWHNRSFDGDTSF